ncbi:myomegalin isoform X13 [Tachysurus ichikawai]
MTSNGYRTISQHLNDLKKENFSLKLRIYFLEEKIQGKFEDGSSEDVHRKVSKDKIKQTEQLEMNYTLCINKSWWSGM